MHVFIFENLFLWISQPITPLSSGKIFALEKSDVNLIVLSFIKDLSTFYIFFIKDTVFLVFTVLNISIFLFYSLIFTEGEEGRKRDRNIREWLPLKGSLLGPWPETQACALTGNWTSDPLVHRPALNPLSHTSQGWLYLFNVFFQKASLSFFI